MRQYLLGVVGWLVVNPILDMMGVKRVIKGGRASQKVNFLVLLISK